MPLCWNQFFHPARGYPRGNPAAWGTCGARRASFGHCLYWEACCCVAKRNGKEPHSAVLGCMIWRLPISDACLRSTCAPLVRLVRLLQHALWGFCHMVSAHQLCATHCLRPWEGPSVFHCGSILYQLVLEIIIWGKHRANIPSKDQIPL
jgi:hypothetical protein